MSGRANPFDELERLIDRLGEEVDGNLLADADVAVDVEERADAYVVRADLPGYDREDVEVELGDGYLSIAAERSSTSESATGEYVRRERVQESVSRTVDVPGPIAPEEASATYDGGVLTVTVPKVGESDGHEIEIE